jgi:cellobiose transport system permease protein
MTSQAQPRRPWTRARIRALVEPFAFIAPFFVLFGIFGIAAIGYTAWISFHEWNPIAADHPWVGLDNYIRLYSDPRFWNALLNTISIWFISTVPQLALALALAHILNEQLLKWKTGFRVSVLIPNITSVVAVGIIFTSIFGRDFGLANYALGILGIDPVDWQTGTLSSHIAISTMVMWRWTGYNTLILLAAMQAIPYVLYEVAQIDGAGRWKQFRNVTVPSIRNTIIFVTIVSTIGGMQIFAEPLIFGGLSGVTGGAARQFQTVALFLYEQGFRNFAFGYAATIAWVLFLVIFVFSIVNLLLTRRIASED